MQKELRDSRDAAVDRQTRARMLIVDHYNGLVDKTDDFVLELKDVYVVWFCKTLQNWKALVSTNVPDGMYYEVTYNGDKRETYVDAYKKIANARIPDLPEEPAGLLSTHTRHLSDNTDEIKG